MDYVYVADILVFSKTKDEHLVYVRMVLDIPEQHRLCAKASQCQFGRASFAFLGHMMSERGVSMGTRKIAAIQDWLHPMSFVHMRFFIGIDNNKKELHAAAFSLAAHPTSFETRWSDAERQSFEAMWKAPISVPVLWV